MEYGMHRADGRSISIFAQLDHRVAGQVEDSAAAPALWCIWRIAALSRHAPAKGVGMTISRERKQFVPMGRADAAGR